MYELHEDVLLFVFLFIVASCAIAGLAYCWHVLIEALEMYQADSPDRMSDDWRKDHRDAMDE